MTLSWQQRGEPPGRKLAESSAQARNARSVAPGSARWSRPVGTTGSASSAAMPAAARRSAAFVDERGCVAAWNPSTNQPPHPPPRAARHGQPDSETAGATCGLLQNRSAHSPCAAPDPAAAFPRCLRQGNGQYRRHAAVTQRSRQTAQLRLSRRTHTHGIGCTRRWQDNHPRPRRECPRGPVRVCHEQLEGVCDDAASATTSGGPSSVGCYGDLLGTPARRRADRRPRRTQPSSAP
jgi:hypothetical protein